MSDEDYYTRSRDGFLIRYVNGFFIEMANREEPPDTLYDTVCKIFWNDDYTIRSW